MLEWWGGGGGPYRLSGFKANGPMFLLSCRDKRFQAQLSA